MPRLRKTDIGTLILRVQANTASTMLGLVLVGRMRVILSRARASRDSYSRGVRSAPPVRIIIDMSALPNPGAPVSRRTSSISRSRLSGVIAWRRLPKIVRHCASFQSWMMCESRYTSAPAGTRSKKLPICISRACGGGGAAGCDMFGGSPYRSDESIARRSASVGLDSSRSISEQTCAVPSKRVSVPSTAGRRLPLHGSARV